MRNIDASLQAKLSEILNTPSVYPNFIPRTDDNEWLGLPAATYRQLDGDRAEFGDSGLGRMREDKYLVEMFSTNAEEVKAFKELIQAALEGPVGGTDDAPQPTQWVEGGPTIYWAIATNPSSDLDAAAYEHHLTLNFEQLTVTITYLMRC